MSRLLHCIGCNGLKGSVFSALLLVLALASTFSRPAQAVGTFISAPYRVDHIHDTKRNLIYISSLNSVLRYNVATGAFLAPFQLSGSLGGMDLSPDGDTLAIANRTGGQTAPNSVYLINLVDGTSRFVSFPLTDYESGTWTVAYGSDGKLLISSRYGQTGSSGWVPLRRYDPATGETTDLTASSFPAIRQDSMLTASGDRSVIGFAESNSSGGPIGTYRVSDGLLTRKDTSGFLYEMGVNSNGTQFSVPTSGGTYVYNSSLLNIGLIGNSTTGLPIGVAYHPTQPKIYLPWSQSGDVRVFDAGTLQQIGSFAFETTFSLPNQRAFVMGRTKVSRDGSLLAVSVPDGVRFVSLLTPIANPQSVTAVEDTALNITLSAQNLTPGTFTSYSIVTPPLRGTISTSPTVSTSSPNKIYTPNPNYYGSDSFVFRVTNGNYSSTATVSITVSPVADIPVAQNSSVSTQKNTPVNFTLLGSDGDNNELTFEIVAAPTSGTVSIEAVGTAVPGTYSTKASKAVYTPNPNYSGSDSFTWRVRDGYYYSNVATTNISVANTSAPIAQNDSYRTPARSTSAPAQLDVAAPGVLANDSDADGNAISARLETQPQLGQVTLQPDGSFSWTAPAIPPGSIPAYIKGDIFFTYRAITSGAQSAPATVTLIQNYSPSATSQSMTTDEDVALAITLKATDADALTYRVVNAPQNGTLSGTAPNLTYTPNANFNGADTFTFMANDGQLDSNLATVSIAVNPVNDAPVATPQNLSGDEDSALDILLAGSDVEGDALTFSVTTQPKHGVLSGTAPNLIYTPNADYFGSDSFAFIANDGQLDSDAATITIALRGSSDTPVAVADTFSTDEDKALSIPAPGVLFNDTDADKEALTALLVVQPQHGGVVLRADGSFLYTPDADYFGADSFTYKASDGVLQSAAVLVSIDIKAVNDAPIANAQTTSTTVGIGKAITLSGSDVEGSALSYSVVSQPANGTLSGTAPNLTYTPNLPFFGTDSFSFRVNDGELNSAPATVSIEVHALPVAILKAATTLEDQAVTLSLAATTSSGATISAWQIVSSPQNGTLAGEGQTRIYIPGANFFGSDSFSYRVQDSRGAWSTPVTVAISVTPVNDAPTFTLSSTALDIAKNSKAQSIAGFARLISAGPGESGQSVAFTLTALSSFFSLQPSIAPNGTLTFQVAKGRTGTTTVQVQLKDTGDTANGGRNLSEVKSFSITSK